MVNESFSNDLVGASEVKEIILDLAQKNHYDKVIIGMEATSINPRQTKKFRDVFEENKNDPVGAYFIAEYLHYGKCRVTIARQDEYLALQRLTRARHEFTQSMVQAKQHFIETLYYRANKLVTVDKDKRSILLSLAQQ
ncbi:hypothetical protein BTH50_07760 [Lactobacillus delbrueckii subsp. bulgaricus]|nr:hypothetical protein [Lactobacillus delbrueckii subsp. bulgaricus]MBT8851405.1 hypothetical protein [Lactobacillus delbrueckii subsp. bulgaricus]